MRVCLVDFPLYVNGEFSGKCCRPQDTLPHSLADPQKHTHSIIGQVALKFIGQMWVSTTVGMRLSLEFRV